MIRRNSLFLAALALGLIAVVAPTQAVVLDPPAVLAQRNFGITRTVNVFTTNQFNFNVEFGNSIQFTDTPDVLFPNLVITPASVGQTFTALPGDVKFAEAAARLTNGTNQAIRFALLESSSGRPEKRGYAENAALNRTLMHPDFAGFKIDKLELTINSFNLQFAASPPPSAAALTIAQNPLDLQFTFKVYGQQIPEPAALALTFGSLGLVAIGLRARRRRSAC